MLSQLTLPSFLKEDKLGYIKLDDSGHRIRPSHDGENWHFYIENTNQPSELETSSVTLKSPEDLLTSRKAKMIRDTFKALYKGYDAKALDVVVQIIQDKSYFWFKEREEDAPVDRKQTDAEVVYEMVVAEGVKLFRDQNDQAYGIVSNFQKKPSDANDANDGSAYNPLVADNSYKIYHIGRETQKAKNASLASSASQCKLHIQRRMVLRLESRPFKAWISQLTHQQADKIMGRETINNVLLLLQGIAQKTPRFELSNRVAQDESGAWWLDLSDEGWRAIRVGDEGWTLVEEPPVLFKRYDHQLPLAEPRDNGKGILDLLDFVNLSSVDHQLLFTVNRVVSLIPTIPHAIEYIWGGKGTFKSTGHRAAKTIFDNSSVGLMKLHEDVNQLIQNLDHHWLAYFDNISTLDEAQSDVFCRAVTGAGISKRALYTDDDDHTRNFRRCPGLNGINIVANKPDFLDRSVVLETKPIPEGSRKTDAEIDAMIRDYAPGVLWDTLNILCAARRIVKTLKIDFPRMADYALWGCAVAEALGIPHERFLVAYRNNILEVEVNVIRSSIVGDLLVQLLNDLLPSEKKLDGRQRTDVERTPTELFSALKKKADDLGINTKTDFPGNPRALSERIIELIPNMPAVGFSVTRKRSGSARNFTFTRLQSTKLDEAGLIQRVENLWEVGDLREYRKAKPSTVVETKAVEAEASPEPRVNLFETIQSITADFAKMNWEEAVRDESLFAALEEKYKLTRTQIVKVISTMMRDGTLFSPRPGFYKFTGGG